MQSVDRRSTWRQERREAEAAENVKMETDADLGIGEPDRNDALAMLMQNPQIIQLIDAAVQQRLGALHAPSDGLGAVVSGIEKLIQMNAAQLPGYSRPLPADEVERRAAGFVEMNALLEQYKRDNTPPQYRLVNEPLFAGEIEYRPGSIVAHCMPPNEHMAPMDDRARQVHAAMMRWIGGPQMAIDERLEEAERERRQTGAYDPSPFQPAGLPDRSPVQVVADPPEERGFDPRRPPQAAHEIAQQGVVHRI